MEQRFEILDEKKLVGVWMKMSLSDNKTAELWRNFMPRRKEIMNKRTTDLFSMQVYSPSMDFINFSPEASFEKWAAIEVKDFDSVPVEMDKFILPGGLYAVFLYKGPASKGSDIFRYIFGTWLPASGYSIDNRPHFEILGEKYKNDDPGSEEEIWIPIKTNYNINGI